MKPSIFLLVWMVFFMGCNSSPSATSPISTVANRPQAPANPSERPSNTGTQNPPQTPQVPYPQEKWQSIISDNGMSFCALDFANSLFCWGANSQAGGLVTTKPEDHLDALGTGLNENIVTEPRKLKFSAQWKQVKMGRGIICGRDQQDKLYCWGGNRTFSFVYGGPYFLPQIGGRDVYVAKTPHLIDNSDWSDLDIFGTDMCGVRKDGSLWCWGEKESSPTPQPKGRGNFVSIQLNTDGLIKSYVTMDANNKVFNNSLPIGTRAFKFIRIGPEYICGIDLNDRAYCQGNNNNNQLGVQSTAAIVPDFVEVIGGGTFLDLITAKGRTCGIKSDKTLWCWGENVIRDYSDPAKNIFDALGTGSSQEFVTQPRQVVGISEVEKITISPRGSLCALTSAHALYCWGNNAIRLQTGAFVKGVLGHADKSALALTKPSLIDAGSAWKSISLFSDTDGFHVNCGIKTDDTLWCWGYQEFESSMGIGNKLKTLIDKPTQVLPRVN